MTNVVIVNRKGVQMRQSNGRFSHKIVPPAVAASIGPNDKPKGTSKVVTVDQGEDRKRVGQGVVVPRPAPSEDNRGPGYRVVK